METLELNGLNFNGSLPMDVTERIENAKELCRGFSRATDGKRHYECHLEIHKGSNSLNTRIELVNKRGEVFGYYLNGKFFATFGFAGQEIKLYN